MSDEAVPPREKSTTITTILPGATNLRMSLPIGLNRILLRALITLPLLLAMLPTVMLLDSSQIPEGSSWVMVHTGRFGADVHLLPNLVLIRPLLKLPWKVMPPAMQLQVLVPLEPLVADLAYKPICRQ
uniref:Uncharacterized protein n=1 Tax=Opuntia streptacantha TaxID=393608 RepID=A0A7C9E0I0_OPUST